MRIPAPLPQTWLCFAVSAVVLGTAQAQSSNRTETNSATKNANEEETVQLSPFGVATDKDKGKRSAANCTGDLR